MADTKPKHKVIAVIESKTIKPIIQVFFVFWVVSFFVACSKKEAEEKATQSEEMITVYSERKEHLIKPLFDLYTEKTGVKIQYITDSAGPLIARLSSEKEATKADMLITVDAGNLWLASDRGVLQAVDSDVLKNNIPANLRAPNNEWFGLSKRARTIIYSTERVKPEELSSYEALGDEKWKGRLCLRTAKKIYNQSLVATMINTLGEAQAADVIKSWVANLATDPFSNDTQTMEAVIAGQCDVAVVKSKKNPIRRWHFIGLIKRGAECMSIFLVPALHGMQKIQAVRKSCWNGYRRRMHNSDLQT